MKDLTSLFFAFFLGFNLICNAQELTQLKSVSENVDSTSLQDSAKASSAKTRLNEAPLYVTTKSTNLYSGPAANSPVLAKIPAGTKLKIFDIDLWCLTMYGNQNGYVKADVLGRINNQSSSNGVSGTSATSHQCNGITKKGYRCTRIVLSGKYCWQHGG